MTIHIDLDNLNIHQPLPKERPVLRHYDRMRVIAFIDAFTDAWENADKHEDGYLFDPADVQRVLKCKDALEAGK